MKKDNIIKFNQGYWVGLVAICCVCWLPIAAFSQTSKTNQIFDLFSYALDIKDVPTLRENTLQNGVLLNLNDQALKKLYTQQPASLTLNLPAGDDTPAIHLELKKVQITTPEFVLNTPDGPINKKITAVHYRGTLPGQQSPSVAFSFYEDDVIGMIGGVNDKNWVLGKLNQPGSRNLFVLYKESDLLVDANFSCGTTELVHQVRTFNEQTPEVRGSVVDKMVRVYFECDYDLVLEKGGATGAANFITGIFNAVSLLYANEGITAYISEIFAWTSPDSYPTTSMFDAINAFRSTRTVFNGDIAHLVSRGQPTGGGVAYTPGLCNTFGYAYSWVQSTYAEIPTYSWSVNVIAHEMGHNLGSAHTHDCAWNGNNTPLDGCGPAAGYSGAGSCTPLPPPSTPFKGTVMSYCHLLSGIGIDFNQGFGPQPGDRIRTTVAAATCLSNIANTCSSPASGQLFTTNLAATSVTLNCSSSGFTSFDWRYRLQGATTWVELNNSSLSYINLNNLLSGGVYEYQVSGQCATNGIWSGWSMSQSYTTLSASMCATPSLSQLSVSNITSTSATLNASVPGMNAYDWRYRLAGSSAWLDVPSSNITTLNLSNLLSSSIYEFQASVQCVGGGVWSAWSSISTFSTLIVGCPAPSINQMSVSNISSTNAQLNCSLVGVSTYQWYYRKKGTTTWIYKGSTTVAQIALGGLLSGTHYEYRIKLKCGSVFSPYSAIGTFATLSALIGEANLESTENTIKVLSPPITTMSLFPNPTKGEVTITYEITQPVEQIILFLFDLNGRVVREWTSGPQTSGLHQTQFEPPTLPGIYLARLKIGKVQLTQRFIVL